MSTLCKRMFSNNWLYHFVMLSMGSVTNQSSSIFSFGQRSPVLFLASLIEGLMTVGDDFCPSQESWFRQRLKET